MRQGRDMLEAWFSFRTLAALLGFSSALWVLVNAWAELLPAIYKYFFWHGRHGEGPVLEQESCALDAWVQRYRASHQRYTISKKSGQSPEQPFNLRSGMAGMGRGRC